MLWNSSLSGFSPVVSKNAVNEAVAHGVAGNRRAPGDTRRRMGNEVILDEEIKVLKNLLSPDVVEFIVHDPNFVFSFEKNRDLVRDNDITMTVSKTATTLDRNTQKPTPVISYESVLVKPTLVKTARNNPLLIEKLESKITQATDYPQYGMKMPNVNNERLLVSLGHKVNPGTDTLKRLDEYLQTKYAYNIKEEQVRRVLYTEEQYPSTLSTENKLVPWY